MANIDMDMVQEHEKNMLCNTTKKMVDSKVESSITASFAMRQMIKAEEALDLTKVDKDLELKHRELKRKVIDILEERNGSINRLHEQAISDMCEIFLYPLKEKKPVVLPIDPGGGKSTALEAYLSLMAETDPTFGCIVVKERIDDLLAIKKSLGESAYAMYGFYNDCLEGYEEYSKGKCKLCKRKDCRVKANYNYQKNKRILLISMERFRLQLNVYSNLDTLLEWYDETENRTHRRMILIIDEKPTISIVNQVKLYEIAVAKNLINGMNCFRDKEDLRRLNKYIQLILRDMISTESSVINRNTNNINQNYLVPSNVYKAYEDNNDFDGLNVLKNIEYLIQEGGLINKADQYCTDNILTKHYVDFSKVSGLKTLILDGTAKYDLEYRQDAFDLIDIPSFREYENLTLWNCNEINTSKTNMRKNNNLEIADFAKEIIEIAAGEKILVLVYKEFEEELTKKIHEYTNGKMDNIYVEHFGNCKGRNDYNFCKKMITIGAFHKGEDYYAAKASAIYKRNFDDLNVQIQKHKGRFFKEIDIEKIKKNDIFIDFVQTILRTAVRNSGNEKVEVYLFLTDPVILGWIADYFVDSTLKNWTPGIFKSPKRYGQDTMDRLKQVVGENLIHPGDTITKKILYEKVGKSKKHMSRLYQKKEFLEFLQENNIVSLDKSIYSKVS